jgi:hypothetical protein
MDNSEIRERIKRHMSLFIATTMKFDDTTPHKVQVEIIKYFSEDRLEEEQPVSMQPYKESIKLYLNMKTLSSHMQTLKDEFPEHFENVNDFFNEMDEAEFVEWFKERKKK